jgi:hypothetical protein
MQTYGNVEVQLHSFLIAAKYGAKWSVSEGRHEEISILRMLKY